MKKYLIALSLVGLVSTSCYEKLNIAPPNSITNEQVMELLRTGNDETVTNIMGALAEALPAQIKGGGYVTFNQPYYAYNYQSQGTIREVSGNDVVLGRTTPGGDIGNLYSCTNLTNPAGDDLLGYWKRGYALVHAANKVFNILTEEMVDNSPSKALKSYAGWGYITRAYGYLWLMENFAYPYDPSNASQLGVPIYTVYSDAQPLKARAPQTEVYDSIFKWLDKGIAYMKEGAVDQGNNFTQNGEGKINLGFAYFIQARAALCAHKWDVAVSACDELIKNYPNLMTEDQYVAQNKNDDTGYPFVYYASNSGFTCLNANPENIFGYTNSNKAYGSQNSLFNVMLGSYQMRIDNRLYDLIDANDYRRANFQDFDGMEYGAPSSTGFTEGNQLTLSSYLNVKFAANVGVGMAIGNTTVSDPSIIDYSMFRVAEAYLMKAEALAQQGQDGPAKEVLNLLLAKRAKAGALLTCDNYSSMAGMTALEMVQLQTRIEMWGERGLEWYNNRRWNIPVNRSGSLDHHNPGLTYPVSGMTLPLPDQETQTNPLIVQN